MSHQRYGEKFCIFFDDILPCPNFPPNVRTLFCNYFFSPWDGQYKREKFREASVFSLNVSRGYEWIYGKVNIIGGLHTHVHSGNSQHSALF